MSQPVPTAARLAAVLQHFPPVTYAFSYGSGAHHQPGLYDELNSKHESPSAAPDGIPTGGVRAPTIGPKEATKQAAVDLNLQAWGSTKASQPGKPVIDYIFVVRDAHKWHQQNLERNPGHYSWVGLLGANTVCGIAEAVGVGVHFNTLVRLDEQTTIKYGVIEAAALAQDLTCWTHLYVAGRLHKPVTPLLEPPPAGPPLAGPDLREAQAANLHNALATALVLLPPTFTEEELLRTLVGLSYRGDVRLLVGAEDPHKVARIVAGSWRQLHDMYLPLLAKSERYAALGVEPAGEIAATSTSTSTSTSSSAAGGGLGASPGTLRLWRQARDAGTQGRALELLPPGLLQEMASRLGFHVPPEHLVRGEATQREVVAAVVAAGGAQRLVADSVAAIVRRSSIYQAAAGLLAAGGGKAVQYVGAKVAKALRPLLAPGKGAPGGGGGGSR